MSLAHELAGEPFRTGPNDTMVPAPAVAARHAPRWRSTGPFIALGLAAIAFSIAYVGGEEPAYFWDWSAYFDRYKGLGALAAKGTSDWLATLLVSIRDADYNLSTVAPLTPIYGIFGDSRVAYVTGIVALYLVPSAAIAARLASRALAVRSGPTPPWLFAAALLFWPLWLAALRGMPDVAGLVPLGGATLLVIETRFLTRASIPQGLCLGLLVWLSFLLRRWYAYTDVALEASGLVFALWTAVQAEQRRAAFRTAAAAFAANLLAIATFVLLFQAPLADRILHTAYGDLYAAYQKPLAETAWWFFARTGGLMMVATALGVVRAVLVRNMAVLFMSVAAAITTVLFLRTQAPGVQHILPVCFWMFPVALFGATWAPMAVSRFGRALVLVAMGAGFSAMLIPQADAVRRFAAPLVPWEAYTPLRLGEAPSYRRLIVDLETRLAAPGSRLAVFASSPHLSGSLLKSLAPRIREAIVTVPDVDARDGFRLAPFTARVAIVTAGPALHLPPQAQRIVAIPAALIWAGTGPGAAYRRVSGPYRLDGGIEAYVYERVRPFTTEDADALSRLVQAGYPHWARHADGLGP